MADDAAGKGKATGVARGRPRAQGVRDRVLAATRAAIERMGYAGTSVDQIAADAHVSKGSIYRRWPSKGLLVYEACVADPDTLDNVIDSGDIRADLLAIARITARGFAGGNELFTEIVAEAAIDRQLMEALRRCFFEPRSERIVHRVEQAVQRGELLPGIDASLVPAVLNGVQQYTWGVRARAMDDDELVRLVEMVVSGYLPRRDT